MRSILLMTAVCTLFSAVDTVTAAVRILEDSPLFNAGHGEYFIRFAAAHDVPALVAYRGWSVHKAAAHVIHQKLKPAGGQLCPGLCANISLHHQPRPLAGASSNPLHISRLLSPTRFPQYFLC